MGLDSLVRTFPYLTPITMRLLCVQCARYTLSNMASAHVLPAVADFAAFVSAMEEALLATAQELGPDLDVLPCVL